MLDLLPFDFVTTGEEHTILILGTVLVPLILAATLHIAQAPSRQRLGALVLTSTWNGVFLLAGNELAVRLGWWTFESAGPQIGNVPVALWVGWVFLWGPLAGQIPVRPVVGVALLGALDLVAMPLMDSVVTLRPTWLVGEAVLLVFVAWPGLLLARWMTERSPARQDHLTPFVLLQVIMFAGILFWFIPYLSVKAAGQDLTLDVAPWAFGAVLAAVGASSIPALIAVHDFYLNSGSPWPWDTTNQPVLSGPYRYVRSPMQASASLVLFVAAAIYWQWPIVVGAVAAVMYASVFCLLERDDLSERFGTTWARVAADQGRWLPSWQPHAESERAVVWINQGCDSCAPIATFLAERNPTQLKIRWAHEHPEALSRMRYERADGAAFDGVAALGACLEHLNLGYAAFGWVLRTPILWRAWQTVGDAVGFGPRDAIAETRPTTSAAG